MPQFACTTPYFRIRDGSDDTCIAEEIDDVLKTYFTFEIPIALTAVMRMCLAALVCTKPYFSRSRSPLRGTALFKINNENTRKFTKSVVVTHAWEESKYWTSAFMGVSENIKLYVAQEDIKAGQERMEALMHEQIDQLNTQFRAELDRRCIGGGDLTMDMICTEISPVIETLLGEY